MHAPSESALASIQARMAAALLASDAAGQALPEHMFAGAHAGAVGLRVHRNTVLGALSHALRLAFPAVDKLVGEAFFDRMAVDYARARPPAAPQLDEYGRDFPDFIAGFPGTETLPYLRGLAQFEWLFAELARCRAEPGFTGPSLQLEGGVRLRFAAPLRLHAARFPVEPLRAAILAGDAQALAAIDLQRGGDCHYALWRSEQGVNLRPVSAASARFLAAVYAGGDAATALAAAASAGGPGDIAIAQLLAQEIVPAGFVQVSATPAG
ncbi:MAG: putative DNA-binding domain-containing protein [Proteobacteria bacterium]|nr:putative DNA-binding domain-containing protein [Pseudomonadota bacterium]